MDSISTCVDLDEERGLVGAGGRQDLHLPRDHEKNEANEDPRNEDMCQIPVLVSRDVAEAQDIKLLLDSSTSGIYWEQDRPADKTAYRANDDRYFDVAEKEIPIKRVVLEYIGVWDLLHEREPAQQRIWRRWRPLLLA